MELRALLPSSASSFHRFVKAIINRERWWWRSKWCWIFWRCCVGILSGARRLNRRRHHHHHLSPRSPLPCRVVQYISLRADTIYNSHHRSCYKIFYSCAWWIKNEEEISSLFSSLGWYKFFFHSMHGGSSRLGVKLCFTNTTETTKKSIARE